MKIYYNVLTSVCCVVLAFIGLESCKGVEWDTEETLIGMSKSWAYWYVGSPMIDYGYYHDDTPDSAYKSNTTIVFNDTVAVEKVYCGMLNGDSINITTTVVKADSTLTVFTDGYRIANNLTAHIFTVDPGIINYKGKLHIDFYLTDGMIPWAWTEVFFNGRYEYVETHPDFWDAHFEWY